MTTEKHTARVKELEARRVAEQLRQNSAKFAAAKKKAR